MFAFFPRICKKVKFFILKNHKDITRLFKKLKECLFPLYLIVFLNKKGLIFFLSFLEKYKKGLQKIFIFWFFLAPAFSYFSGTIITFLGHSIFGLTYPGYSMVMLAGFFYFQLINFLQEYNNSLPIKVLDLKWVYFIISNVFICIVQCLAYLKILYCIILFFYAKFT